LGVCGAQVVEKDGAVLQTAFSRTCVSAWLPKQIDAFMSKLFLVFLRLLRVVTMIKYL
jgi:hypothetical protein